jgi:hypothetical protein
MLDCCKGAYGGQISGKCLAALPSPPTQSPTATGGLEVYYPDYDTAWSDATCINERPLPSGRPTYDTMLDCCKGAYGGQVSGKCLAALPSPPTQSPTGSGGLDVYYPKPGVAWTEGYCINERPFPNNVGQGYDDMLACCKGAFGGQVSGKCLAELPSPPTSSPTASGGLDVWYPKPGAAWNTGYCINDGPFPNNVGQPYDTEEECCNGAYRNQASNDCMCKVDLCYSCNCGSISQLDAGGCLELENGDAGTNGDLDCGQWDEDR